MSQADDTKGNISIHPDVLALKAKAQKEGLETIWERFAAQQPQCDFCEPHRRHGPRSAEPPSRRGEPP